MPRPPTVERLRPHLDAAIPGLIAVTLMALWAEHDGGYDADTWYWGALVLLGLFSAACLARVARLPGPGPLRVALGAFSLYVAWSYLSIAWAQYPGDALTGSNRALMYLLMFALFAMLPWTPRAAFIALVSFAVAIGLLAVLVLAELAGSHAAAAFSEGRLLTPTGYLNSTAALFTLGALTAIALASRRELSPVLRGLLLAVACPELQLALMAQSRGWLFTLPLVAVLALALVRDRLRVVAAAVLPLAGALAVLSASLEVFKAFNNSRSPQSALVAAANRAGRDGLLAFAVLLVLGIGLTALEARMPAPELGARSRRVLAAALAVVALLAAGGAATAATHGHPLSFVQRQWHGFIHPPLNGGGSGSHFAAVGSGRYDMWRVAVDATLAHPIGGLGQDNFADYYVARRHSLEEPEWTHSLEMRLLASTGVVGFLIFGVFVVSAIIAALTARRMDEPWSRWLAPVALLPLTVWLVHGSLDWFWEMPALSGPALGLLGMAGALAARARPSAHAAAPSAGPNSTRREVSAAALGARPVSSGIRMLFSRLRPAVVVLLLLAAALVLALPYLAVREISTASDIRGSSPAAALSDLSTAADLNPLSSDPGRLGGTIALQTGQFIQAEARFAQATSREPGDWFSWLGRGLAASALGDTAQAAADYRVAARINSVQPAVPAALARVDTTHPLTPRQAFALLVLHR